MSVDAEEFVVGALMGAVAAAGVIAVVAAVAAATSPAPPVTSVDYCASRTDPPVRVDDAFCPEGFALLPGYGEYNVQVPDGGGGLVIVSVGQPVYPAGSTPSGSWDRPPATAGRSVRAPTVAPGQASPITRGGLGGAARGGSSGS